MTESLSKGQIDRLGNVIRDGNMGENEWLQFEALRRRCNEVELAMDVEIRAAISDPDIDITPRFKNIETIREKLRRSPMRLSQMRDIVGFRIVAPGGRLRQDEISARLCTRFQGHKVRTIDRRRSPTHGYRALHIEVEFDGVVVEIQIRTPLQHEWAEAFERLSDICGRGIRYGEPLLVDHLKPLLQNLLRAIFDALVALSDLIDAYEDFDHTRENTPAEYRSDIFNEFPFDFEAKSREVLKKIKELRSKLTEVRKTLD